MKKQIVFVIVSIMTFILSIGLIEKMMNAIGGTGLGVFLEIAIINVLYSIYAIYHLFTYNKKIYTILIVYWITVLPYMTMWIWGL